MLKRSAIGGVKRLIRSCRVEEQDSDVRRRHQVLDIAMGARHAFELGLQLGVDGLQFLVDRLQLFLAGFELLGGRAILLVDRLQFLVGGAQLLVGALVFVMRDAQLRLGDLQLLLKLANLFARRPFRARPPVRRRFALEEKDDRRAVRRVARRSAASPADRPGARAPSKRTAIGPLRPVSFRANARWSSGGFCESSVKNA